MADSVQAALEDQVPQLFEARRSKLFGGREIKRIVEKRRDYEYKIRGGGRGLRDYVRYVEWELQLERLRTARARARKVSGRAQRTSSGVPHIHRVCGRAARRWPEDPAVWEYWASVCERTGSLRLLSSSVLVQALAYHPRNLGFWLAVIRTQRRRGAFATVRRLLILAVRQLPQRVALWVEYVRHEALMLQLVVRSEVASSLPGQEAAAGAPPSPSNAGAPAMFGAGTGGDGGLPGGKPPTPAPTDAGPIDPDKVDRGFPLAEFEAQFDQSPEATAAPAAVSAAGLSSAADPMHASTRVMQFVADEGLRRLAAIPAAKPPSFELFLVHAPERPAAGSASSECCRSVFVAHLYAVLLELTCDPALPSAVPDFGGFILQVQRLIVENATLPYIGILGWKLKVLAATDLHSVGPRAFSDLSAVVEPAVVKAAAKNLRFSENLSKTGPEAECSKLSKDPAGAQEVSRCFSKCRPTEEEVFDFLDVLAFVAGLVGATVSVGFEVPPIVAAWIERRVVPCAFSAIVVGVLPIDALDGCSGAPEDCDGAQITFAAYLMQKVAACGSGKGGAFFETAFSELCAMEAETGRKLALPLRAERQSFEKALDSACRADSGALFSLTTDAAAAAAGDGTRARRREGLARVCSDMRQRGAALGRAADEVAALMDVLQL